MISSYMNCHILLPQTLVQALQLLTEISGKQKYQSAFISVSPLSSMVVYKHISILESERTAVHSHMHKSRKLQRTDLKRMSVTEKLIAIHQVKKKKYVAGKHYLRLTSKSRMRI